MKMTTKEINSLLKGSGITFKKLKEDIIKKYKIEIIREVKDQLKSEIKEEIENRLKIQCPVCHSFDHTDNRKHNGVFGPGGHSTHINYICNKCGVYYEI